MSKPATPDKSTTPCAALQRQLALFSTRLQSSDPTWAELLADYAQPPAGVVEFVTSPLYLDLADEVYPQVLATLEQLFAGDYDEAVLCWGIGSGKSWLSSLALLYMAHLVLCLRDPQRHFGLSPGSQIALVIMGPSSRQVRSVIFSDIAALVKRSPWFQVNFPPLATRSDSVELAKNLVIAAGNSADTAVLGFNVLAAVIDEAAWLTESLDGRRQSADDIYTALQRRIKSRFGDRGLLLMVSSPKHSADFIMGKLSEAERNRRIFASQKPVWEVKPADRFCGQTFEHRGLAVPVEYHAEFQRDPHKAMRDLAAQPQGAWHGLFSDMEPLYSACDESLRPPVIEERLGLADWFRAPDSRPRYVHVDLGLRHDACGIAMAVAEDDGVASASVSGRDNVSAGYKPSSYRTASGASLHGGSEGVTVTVELMARIVPPPGGEVNLAQVRSFILALRERGFVIGGVSYDGYQSADSRQILRRRGLPVKIISVDRDLSRYQMLKELAHEGRLRLYRYGPFFEEASQLEVVRERRVDHPRGGSKDVTDAVAGAVSEALLSGHGGVVEGRVV